MSVTGGHDRHNDEVGGEVVPFRLRPATTHQAGEVEDASGHQPGDDLAPVDASDVEHQGPVYEAEIVEEDKPATKSTSLVGPVVRWVQPVVIVVRQARQHEPTVRTSKLIVRQVAYVFAGVAVLLKRWWNHRTRYERYVRSAEAAGDREAMLEWDSRGEQARERRHKRRKDLLQLPGQIARGLVTCAVVVLVLLLLAGLVAVHEDGEFLGPARAVIDAVAWLFAVVAWTAGWLSALGPVLVLGFFWHLGRSSGDSSAWKLAPKQNDQANAAITADAIVRALQKLGNSKLDKAFKKDGWIPPFELPPTREGTGSFKGYRAIFGLPEGVTPGMVIDAVEVLAANLGRTTVECWPADYGQQKGGKARHINLYVADRGVMDRPTPTYPLMHEGAADVFAGVPIGITQRGDTVLMPMNGSNFVFGGRPGQGKSNAVRVSVAGVALDPLAEIRVHVFAGNGDFDAYEPRLSRYMKGASPEHAAAAVAHLEELLAEVERREYRLAELGAKKVTRTIAQQHPDMRPLLVVFSECHELFTDKESGELAADLAIPVLKRGRKTGVITGWDTQSSRANAIPSALVENMGVNGCFSVKTWRSNDGFLGDGSFAAGIRATELRFNVDRGTMIATGMTDELFELVRTYFIEVNDDTGWDAATQIIERAMAQLDPKTTVDAAPSIEEAPDRDLLADVDVLLERSGGPATAGALLGALRTLAPDWPPYQDLNVPGLVKALKDCGVDVKSTGNRYPVHPDAVRKARGSGVSEVSGPTPMEDRRFRGFGDSRER